MIYVIAALLLILAGGGYYFFYIACRADCKLWNRKPDQPLKGYRLQAYENQQEMDQVPYRDMEIESEDHLKLHARYYVNPTASRTIVCCHGYHGTGTYDFGSILPVIMEDANILLIDERCCGESEGKYITFGAKEKKDIRRWVSYILEYEKHRYPVFLYGISMGAASVLMNADMDLPEDVKGIIADCGYTSMRDVTSYIALKWYHVPSFPLMFIMELYCLLLGHFSMKDADARKAVQACKLPVLFIHGTKDTFVITEYSKINYEACTGEKELLLVEGASHGISCLVDPVKYFSTVGEFLEKYTVQ